MKKSSIRIRFTVIFISILAATLLTTLAVNHFFLLDFYVSEKVDVLQLAYETADKMVGLANEDNDSIVIKAQKEFDQNITDSATVAFFRTLNDRSNINVVIIDKHENAMVTASREGEFMTGKLKLYLEYRNLLMDGRYPGVGEPVKRRGHLGIIHEINSRFSSDGGLDENNLIRILAARDDYVIDRIYDKRTGTTYLESWGYFSDGETSFLMSMPIAALADSAHISNRFYIYAGLINALISSLIIFGATSLITKPINKLAVISRKMADLDFSEKFEVTDESEIGILGQSMNTMSDKLEMAINQLKEANSMLQQDLIEKERIDEARKAFISDVSHELKTPIALIEGYAEGLTEGMAEDPESRDYYCEVIMDEAQKMNKLVKQLTSLTNIEFGRDQAEMTNFDLPEMVRAVVSAQQLKLTEKEIKVELDLPEVCFVNADEFKIEEVLTNYLTNAINHISGERHLKISVLPSDDTVYLKVYNDGEPIPEESLPHLWDKFYKVDKARTRAYGGSGIGLSIVKAIMELHDQSYGVRNLENGVEFYITLASSENSIWSREG